MKQDVFIGIDLHSNNFNICKIDSAGTKTTQNFSFNRPADVEHFATSLEKNTHIMVEASTNTFSFCDRIRPTGSDILVANPYKLKLISMVNKKTDRVDAEKLAVILKMQVTTGEKLFEPVFVPDPHIRNLRSLFTTYKFLIKQRNAIKNRIRSIYRQNLIVLDSKLTLTKPCIRRLENIELPDSSRFQVNMLIKNFIELSGHIKNTQKTIKNIGVHFLDKIDILTSMRGISVFMALALLADIGDISRFKNSKKLASYLRSAPGIDSSNQTTRILSVNKQSRKLAISFLTQALAHFKTTNPKIRAWTEKKDGKKGKGKLRMAVCRKVITEIYQMLSKNQYHYYREITNHHFKMNAYKNYLKRQKVLI